MEIKLRVISKTGLKHYLENVVGLNIVEVVKWKITKRGVISVVYILPGGKKGSTFISTRKYKEEDVRRMIGRVSEVTQEKCVEYNTNVYRGKCECESHKFKHYQVNGIVVCKHLVYVAKSIGLSNLHQLTEYIKLNNG